MFKEQEAVHRILKGDMQAFTQLVEQYEKLVFHVAARIVFNEHDREDVCQEVFIKVHQNLKNFHFQSRLSTWIARIAYLTAINYLKKYQKHTFSSDYDQLDNYYFTTEDPAHLLIKKDVNAYIGYLMEQMPGQYRALLTLFHLDEFSLQEIAGITGMPEGTVKNYLFRGRKLLKEKLEKYLKNEFV